MRHTIYCLNRAPVYHMVIVSITIMLFITSPLLMHLKVGSLYLLTGGFPDGSAGKESACHAGDTGEAEEEIKTHPSILAGKISWTEEAGGLQSMGSQRVGHNWAHGTHTYTYTRRQRYLSPNLHITLDSKRNFADGIMLRILTWREYPRLSSCPILS